MAHTRLLVISCLGSNIFVILPAVSYSEALPGKNKYFARLAEKMLKKAKKELSEPEPINRRKSDDTPKLNLKAVNQKKKQPSKNQPVTNLKQADKARKPHWYENQMPEKTKSYTDGSFKGQRGKKEVEVKYKKKRTYKKKKDEDQPVTILKQDESPRKQYQYEKEIPEKTKSYSEGSYKGQQGKKKPVVRYKKKRTYQKVSSISLKK